MIKKLILASSLLVTSLMAEKNHTEFANKMLNTIPYGWNFDTTTCEDIEKEFKFQYYSDNNIFALYSNDKRYRDLDVWCHVDNNLFNEIILHLYDKDSVKLFEPFKRGMSRDRAMRILRKYYNLSDIKIKKMKDRKLEDFLVRLTENVELRLKFDLEKSYGLRFISLYRISK
jgi:hypothetical protein